MGTDPGSNPGCPSSWDPGGRGGGRGGGGEVGRRPGLGPVRTRYRPTRQQFFFSTEVGVADPGSAAFLSPGWVKVRIRIEQPGSYFRELRNHSVWLKYLNSLMRIRDQGWRKNSDPGSGKRTALLYTVYVCESAWGRSLVATTRQKFFFNLKPVLRIRDEQPESYFRHKTIFLG